MTLDELQQQDADNTAEFDRRVAEFAAEATHDPR